MTYKPDGPFDGFMFIPDLKPCGGLVVFIPSFGPWWLDRSWYYEETSLDQLPIQEDFCDKGFAKRLNAAIYEYITTLEAWDKAELEMLF